MYYSINITMAKGSVKMKIVDGGICTTNLYHGTKAILLKVSRSMD